MVASKIGVLGVGDENIWKGNILGKYIGYVLIFYLHFKSEIIDIYQIKILRNSLVIYFEIVYENYERCNECLGTIRKGLPARNAKWRAYAEKGECELIHELIYWVILFHHT